MFLEATSAPSHSAVDVHPISAVYVVPRGGQKVIIAALDGIRISRLDRSSRIRQTLPRHHESSSNLPWERGLYRGLGKSSLAFSGSLTRLVMRWTRRGRPALRSSRSALRPFQPFGVFRPPPQSGHRTVQAVVKARIAHLPDGFASEAFTVGETSVRNATTYRTYSRSEHAT